MTEHETFLNHAAVGPISSRVMAAVQAQMMRHLNDPFNMSSANHAVAAEASHPGPSPSAFAAPTTPLLYTTFAMSVRAHQVSLKPDILCACTGSQGFAPDFCTNDALEGLGLPSGVWAVFIRPSSIV